MTEFLAILGIINAALPIITEGISFVEKLFNGQKGKSEDKKEMAMAIAKVGINGLDLAQGREGTWTILEPHMDKIIDEVVQAVNEYNAKNVG